MTEIKDTGSEALLPVSNDLEAILNIACAVTRQNKTDVCSDVRNREFVTARQIFCHLARNKTKLSLENIGNKINKDHSSVSYSDKEINKFLGIKDPLIVDLVDKANKLFYERELSKTEEIINNTPISEDDKASVETAIGVLRNFAEKYNYQLNIQ